MSIRKPENSAYPEKPCCPDRSAAQERKEETKVLPNVQEGGQHKLATLFFLSLFLLQFLTTKLFQAVNKANQEIAAQGEYTLVLYKVGGSRTVQADVLIK